ncbi:hypothetical protein [Vulgatibacter sp.]|uniref:hypothetical protein n=1 Tax=Vulgatibacter sp. TaxID=1971226 RepID=UPI00356AA068
MSRITVIAALLLLGGCGDREPAPHLNAKRTDRVTADRCTAVGWVVLEDGSCEAPDVRTEEECRALGGESYHLALDDDPATCFLPTPDAGLPCTDGSQCAGFCEAPAETEPGTLVEGTCSARTQELCWTEVRDGLVHGTICF